MRAATHPCDGCGTVIRRADRGKPRLFCSRVCYLRTWRARRAAAEDAA